MAAKPESRIDTVVSLCKRRGFVFPSGEIYGGTRSAWDYGPLGVELKENVKRQWWRSMVTGRDDIVGLDSSVILPTQTWEASGHVATFTDPLTECQYCHRRFRADHLAGGVRGEEGRRPPTTSTSPTSPAPTAAPAAPWTEPREFTGLLKTYLGVGRGRVRTALPAPGDRTGHLPQLPQRDELGAQEAAVRHRPDRQELPQRDHARQLHLPHARVRADGDGVLRRARHRRGLAPDLDRPAHPLVRRPRYRRCPRIMSGSDMRATPPSRRMSAGTRSSAITAQAPASSATFACSESTTSMITPPLSISARPLFTRIVPTSCIEMILAIRYLLRLPSAAREEPEQTENQYDHQHDPEQSHECRCPLPRGRKRTLTAIRLRAAAARSPGPRRSGRAARRTRPARAPREPPTEP